MTHSDDDGLILPPRVAPKHIVILPIYKNAEEEKNVLAYCENLQNKLKSQFFYEEKLRVEIDKRDLRGGEKAWQHIKKGTPLRVEIGPRDVEANSVFLGRRDHPPKDKQSMAVEQFIQQVPLILADIQDTLLKRAIEHRKLNTQHCNSVEELEAFFGAENADDDERNQMGGFALCHWNEKAIGSDLMKRLKVTVRCIPLEGQFAYVKESGRCIFTGEPSHQRVILAKAY
jgi:prolyl-tRNA synthetase